MSNSKKALAKITRHLYHLDESDRAELLAQVSAPAALPGTVGAVPEEVKAEAAQVARQAGLVAGHYELWQLGQLLSTAVVNRDNLWLDGMATVFEVQEALAYLDKLEYGVLAVAATGGKLYQDTAGQRVTPFHPDIVADIARATAHALMVCDKSRRAGGDIPAALTHEVTNRFAMLANALRLLQNGHDNGAALEQYASEMAPFGETLQAWRDAMPGTGRPPGMLPDTLSIARRVHDKLEGARNAGRKLTKARACRQVSADLGGAYGERTIAEYYRRAVAAGHIPSI